MMRKSGLVKLVQLGGTRLLLAVLFLSVQTSVLQPRDKDVLHQANVVQHVQAAPLKPADHHDQRHDQQPVHTLPPSAPKVPLAPPPPPPPLAQQKSSASSSPISFADQLVAGRQHLTPPPPALPSGLKHELQNFDKSALKKAPLPAPKVPTTPPSGGRTLSSGPLPQPGHHGVPVPVLAPVSHPPTLSQPVHHHDNGGASSSEGAGGFRGSHSGGPAGRAPDGTMLRPAGTTSHTETVAAGEAVVPDKVIAFSSNGARFVDNPALGSHEVPGTGSLVLPPSTEPGRKVGGGGKLSPAQQAKQNRESFAELPFHGVEIEAPTKPVQGKPDGSLVTHPLPAVQKTHDVSALEHLPFHDEEIEAPTKPVQGKPDGSLVTHSAEPVEQTEKIEGSENFAAEWSKEVHRLGILNHMNEQARLARLAAHQEMHADVPVHGTQTAPVAAHSAGHHAVLHTEHHEEQASPAGGAMGMLGMMGSGMMGGGFGGGEAVRPESFEKQLHEQEGGHEHREHAEPEVGGEQAGHMAMMPSMLGTGMEQSMPMGGMPTDGTLMASGGAPVPDEPVAAQPQSDDLMDRLIKWLKAYPEKVLELLQNVSVDDQKIELIVPLELDDAGNAVPLGVTIDWPDQEKGVGSDPALGFDPLQTQLVAPATFPVNGEDVPFDEAFLREIVPDGIGNILADMLLLWGQNVWLLKVVLHSVVYNAQLATNQAVLESEATSNQQKVAAEADPDAAKTLQAALQEQLAAHAVQLQADADASFMFNFCFLLSRFAHSVDMQNADVAAGKVGMLSGPDEVLSKAPAVLACVLDNMPMPLSASMSVYANDYGTVGFYDAPLTKVVSDMFLLRGYNARTNYLRDKILPLITAERTLSEKALLLVALRLQVTDYNKGFVEADDPKLIASTCAARLTQLQPVLGDAWSKMKDADFSMFNTGDLSDFLDNLEKQPDALASSSGELERAALELAGSNSDPLQVPLREFIRVWFICLMDHVVHARFDGGVGDGGIVFEQDAGFLPFDYTFSDALAVMQRLLGLALRGAGEKDGQTMRALLSGSLPEIAARAGSNFAQATGWLDKLAPRTVVSGFVSAVANIVDWAAANAVTVDESGQPVKPEAIKSVEAAWADAVLDKDVVDKVSVDTSPETPVDVEPVPVGGG